MILKLFSKKLEFYFKILDLKNETGSTKVLQVQNTVFLKKRKPEIKHNTTIQQQRIINKQQQ